MNQDRVLAEEVSRRKAAESELERSYQELRKAHEELKESHKVLLHSEKMASLGVLSAGVAHEINNPVGYILSNITTLGEYLPQIRVCTDALMQLVSEISEDNPLHLRRIKVEQMIQDNELSYLMTDIKELVDETREGAVRVLDIVKGLKNFAHAHDDAIAEADVNECLRSTLNLVNNELKYHCQIETVLGDIPHIHCSVSKLGQVFMNILVNAGHAISENGLIRITTQAVENCVQIAIEDNGCGMTEQTQQSIFEPFFTTKDKARGTGLGLAISNGIIEEHGGSIRVRSTLGAGTTFTIRLPVHPNPDRSAQ